MQRPLKPLEQKVFTLIYDEIIQGSTQAPDSPDLIATLSVNPSDFYQALEYLNKLDYVESSTDFHGNPYTSQHTKLGLKIYAYQTFGPKDCLIKSKLIETSFAKRLAMNEDPGAKAISDELNLPIWLVNAFLPLER